MEYDKDGFKVERIKKRRNDFFWVGVLAFIFLVVGLAVIVPLFLLPAAPVVLPDAMPTEVPIAKVTYTPDVSPVVYYGIENHDAMEVTWSHAVNSKQLLAEAVAGDSLMLEVDVILRGHGTPAQSDVPVAAHPPLVDSDVTVAEWLEAVLKTDKGIKLDFKSLDAVAPTLRLLQSHEHHIKRPLWLNADIMPGPNFAQESEEPVPAAEFLSTVNQLFPNCTLSLGWNTEFYHDQDNEGYTRDMVQEMHAVTKDLRQPVTFPVRTSLVGQSLENLQWLLGQSDRYTLSLWTSLGDAHRMYDLVRLRKAVSPSRVYYDLPRQQREDLKEAIKVNVTGLNPLFFFPVARRDGLLLTWSGRTNSRATLQEAILSKSNIVEADIILRGHGTESQTNEPIMARPPVNDSDVTFEEWFETIMAAEHDVVPKLDFWSADAVVPVMNIIKNHVSHIDFPMIVTCRPLGTPDSQTKPLDPHLVYPTIYNFFPPGVSSAISFVNVTPATAFPEKLAEDAHALARDMLREPISFTLRDDVIETSLPAVKWLLGQSDSYGLTVASPETISPVIRSEFDWGKLIYDGPRDVIDTLRDIAGTGGGLVNFFQSTYKIYGRDGLDIRWAHGVNSIPAYHQQAMHGRPVMMVEADVNIREDNVPIMSEHKVGNGSDVYTLEDWLGLTPYFGIMLEFHSVEALVPSLQILQSKGSALRQPVMLKAEIPGLFTKETFIDPILDMYPHVSFVIGMKPDNMADGYSRSQVEEIARMCANLTQIVVLSVDARHVRGSWDNLSWLLGQSPLYHLYIWAGWPEPETYSVDVTDLVFVRNNFDHSRVYYDVTPDIMEKFKMALN
ncbi:FAM151B [Branchiostoma lanceolatum]|uniref:FAM151B protein n=1 Tax=Branchiostoma lanceolatum TaxID=7740 RepID=A0A8J9Z589_BRALA|nr:FAM151B [Branchiostoma lanceolatum]